MPRNQGISGPTGRTGNHSAIDPSDGAAKYGFSSKRLPQHGETGFDRLSVVARRARYSVQVDASVT